MNEELQLLFEEWGDNVILEMQAILTAQDNVATGNLRNSIKYIMGENFISFSMDKYGGYVDDGTKPHWAPIAPFKRWASAKGFPPSRAYQTRAAIAKYGTRPHKFFTTVIEKEIQTLLSDGRFDDFFTKFLDSRVELLNKEAQQ